jgi:hypothetical protein
LPEWYGTALRGEALNWGRTLALTMSGEDVIIALVYLIQGNWRMAIYWFAAAVIGVAVVW